MQYKHQIILIILILFNLIILSNINIEKHYYDD